MNAWLSEAKAPCGHSSGTSSGIPMHAGERKERERERRRERDREKKKKKKNTRRREGEGGAGPGREKGKKEAEVHAMLRRSCLATADACQAKEQKRRRETRANPKKRRREEREEKTKKQRHKTADLTWGECFWTVSGASCHTIKRKPRQNTTEKHKTTTNYRKQKFAPENLFQTATLKRKITAKKDKGHRAKHKKRKKKKTKNAQHFPFISDTKCENNVLATPPRGYAKSSPEIPPKNRVSRRERWQKQGESSKQSPQEKRTAPPHQKPKHPPGRGGGSHSYTSRFVFVILSPGPC